MVKKQVTANERGGRKQGDTSQHVKTRGEAKNTMLDQRVCAHMLNTHTPKWIDSSRSKCQLLPDIKLLPQDIRLQHTHTLKPILLTMMANGKRQRLRWKKNHSTKQSRINMRISTLHAFPLTLFQLINAD